MTNESNELQSKKKLIKAVKERQYRIAPLLARIQPTYHLPIMRHPDTIDQEVMPVWIVNEVSIKGGSSGIDQPFYLSSRGNIVQLVTVTQTIISGGTCANFTITLLAETRPKDQAKHGLRALLRVCDGLLEKNAHLLEST